MGSCAGPLSLRLRLYHQHVVFLAYESYDLESKSYNTYTLCCRKHAVRTADKCFSSYLKLLSFHTFTTQSIHPSIHLPTNPFICLFIFPSSQLSITCNKCVGFLSLPCLYNTWGNISFVLTRTC